MNRGLASVALVCVIINAASNVALINFFRKIFDSEGQVLAIQFWHFPMFLLITFVFGVLSQWLIFTLSYRVVYQLRGRLLEQILRSEYEHLQQIGKNRLYALLTKDISNIESGFTSLPYFLYGSCSTVGVLTFLAFLSYKIALFVFVGMTIGYFLSRLITHRFHTLIQKERELEDSLFGAYQTILEGHKELLLNEVRGLALLKGVMLGVALKMKELLTAADGHIVVNMHITNVITMGSVGLVFWAAHAWHWSNISTATTFALGLMFVRTPMNMAINQLPSLLTAKVSLQKLASLKLAQIKSVSELAIPLKTNWQQIEFQAVQYCYPGSDRVDFGPNSFIVNRGELLFLTGKNGSGKSTFIKLFVGLLIPSTGKILIDGQEINAENRRHYRAIFSAVLADFFLFDQVIVENDSQRNFKFADDLAKQMLRDLQLDKIVDVKDGKLSQTELSTGQRKRLAMLQAFMEQRSIMVLDEWAADQDPYFRQIFYEKLLPKLKEEGITVIVASHDDRYFHVADRVIVFDQGEGRSCFSVDDILC